MSDEENRTFPVEWWGGVAVRNCARPPGKAARPELLFKADGSPVSDIVELSFETELGYFFGDVYALASDRALDLIRLCFERGLVDLARARHAAGVEFSAADIEACLGVTPSFRAPDTLARVAAFAGALALTFADHEVDETAWSTTEVMADLEKGWPSLRFDLLPGDVAFRVGVILARFAALADGVEDIVTRRLRGDQPLQVVTSEAMARARAWEEEARRHARKKWQASPKLTQNAVARLIEDALHDAGARNANGGRLTTDSIARAIRPERPNRWRK